MEDCPSPAKRFKSDKSQTERENVSVTSGLQLELTSPEKRLEQQLMMFDQCAVKPVD